uniref:CYP86A33 fatty acid omega-hydroxylase n=1 Tax=Solanum tuberosum TaxID=4113 RepID=M0ZPU8_SOLTU
MLFNKERIHEWTIDQLFASATLGTYQTYGICIPFFHNWRQTFTTVTCHPKTFEHILRTSFNNYPKGPTWKHTFRDHVRGSQGLTSTIDNVSCPTLIDEEEEPEISFMPNVD